MEILSVEGLSFTHAGCSEPAVRDVSFRVREGELIVLCGATGCGKSTLLRLLKPELAPNGTQHGRIHFTGTGSGAARIGFVMQRPEQQIVTDRVWHELAFGLENLGVPQEIMAARIAEMASYFGIEEWYDRDTASLSGGQKQLLNLAAVMVMEPELLILDEPTAQLDPIAASEFIAVLHRLSRDFSLTILVAEHRLEELIPLCDRLLVMEAGRLILDDTPRQAAHALRRHPARLCAMPAPVRLGCLLGTERLPLTVREGRTLTAEYACNPPEPAETAPLRTSPALTLEHIRFRYDRACPDVLQDLNLTVHEGEICCLLGGNGSGKSTALGVAAGLLRPMTGEVRVFGKPLRRYRDGALYRECLAMLPQDVQTLFLRHTVREELADAGALGMDFPFDLSHLYDRHPYDLSGGEQQLTALAKILAQKPRLLLLDEPTKGLDAAARQTLTGILRQLQAQGVTLVIVTHDAEFAAQCADRCVMFFRGQAVCADIPARFFSSNRFYTTAASRMSRGILPETVTVEAIAACCRTSGGAPC